MNNTEMKMSDIGSVLPLYIDYYNNHKDCCWTEETAGKRIQQVLSMIDSFSLLTSDETENAIGFVMGFFKQYDNILGYTLEEIIILADYQNKGLGRRLLDEIEKRAREKGASCVELQAVNDGMHERYYGKAGYKNAANFVMKVKWFE